MNVMTFPSVGNVIIPSDEIIFFIGVGQPPTRIDNPCNPYNPYSPYSPCITHYTELYNHQPDHLELKIRSFRAISKKSFADFFFGSQDRIPDHDIIGYTAEYQSFHKGQ